VKPYLDHPGLLFGLLWAFWMCVALGISVLCIPLAFWSKCALYTYRISRAIIWGTIPLVVLFFVGSLFDAPGGLASWLIGIAVSILPALPAMVAFVLSRRNLKVRAGNT
jgi:hypothetical protein